MASRRPADIEQRLVTPPLPARAAAATPLARPTAPRLLVSDLWLILGGATVATLAAWVRHGGVSMLADGWVQAWTSLTQLTGLLASGAGLAGLVLVARPRAVERRVGLDRMFVWHRYLGEAMAVLVAAHVAASVVAWSNGTGVWTAVRDLTGREQYMAWATVGAGLILLVTLTSLRRVRRLMSYETWWFVHLLSYVGFALSFSHTIVIGGDFADDAVARAAWIAVHVVVAAMVLWGRWGHTARSVLRPLRLLAAERQNDDTVELRLGGRNLASRTADAGQFFVLRPLAPRLWWQAHPFSLSGAPDSKGLRFTVKDRGDASAALSSLPIGTRIAVEGPYGVETPAHLDPARKLLFVIGGVGVAPVRAILERLPAESEPVVLFRAHRGQDLVHIGDLQRLATARGGVVRVLVGPTATLAVKDPFGAAALRAAVPDIAERQLVVCGPDRLVAAARAGARAVGVPRQHIHFERSWW